MKTIGERYGCATCKREFCGDCEQGFKVLGAKEQKAIDDNHLREVKKMVIEKACEWLKAYNITFTQTPSMLENFKRAMEEYI